MLDLQCKNDNLEAKVSIGINKLKQGKKLITGTHEYIMYENECFVWVENLENEINTQVLSVVAVRMSLELCNDWI